jgi:hypothetical protein
MGGKIMGGKIMGRRLVTNERYSFKSACRRHPASRRYFAALTPA